MNTFTSLLCAVVLGLLATSEPARAAAPVITTAPAQRTVVTVGAPLNLSVAATGDTALTYQWKKNGFLLAGATASTYSNTAVTAQDSGLYAVIVTDGNGGMSTALANVLVSHPQTQVLAWGSNYYGETNVPSGLSGVVALAAGDNHSLGLKNDGTVVTWGDNEYGETMVPTGLGNVVLVVAGQYHSLALKSDGTVVAWGANIVGQSAVPAGLNNVIALAGCFQTLALKADGTVIGWGSNSFGQATVPTGLSNVAAVAAGSGHSLALKADGTVVAWGWNNVGQTKTPADLNGVVAIAAGTYHSLALKADGTVVAWGDNSSGQSSVPTGLTNVIAVSAGGSSSLALKADGTVVVWGAVATTSPTSLDNVVAMALGTSHATILRDSSQDAAPSITQSPASQSVLIGQTITLSAAASGLLVSYQWQKDGVPIVGATGPTLLLSNVQPDATGGYTVVVTNYIGSTTSAAANLVVLLRPAYVTATPAARTVLTVGQPLYLSVGVTGGAALTFQWKKNGLPLAGATAAAYSKAVVTAQDGGYYSVEVTDGTGLVWRAAAFVNVGSATSQLVAWGDNLYGQVTVPAGLDQVVAVAAGASHSLALKSDGTVVAWGLNTSGQATIPAGLSNVVAMAAGSSHSVALQADGTVVGWGGYSGLTTPPANLSGVVAVAAGNGFSLALKVDGTVVAWGSNDWGQALVPVGLNHVVGIAAGFSHALAVKSDGTVVAWGSNIAGEATVPAGLGNVAAVAAGDQLSLALKADGTVVAWGLNSDGQITVPAGFGNGLAVAAGNFYSLALRANGLVETWGVVSYDSAAHPIARPAGVINATKVAAGGNHVLVLRDPSLDPLAVITPGWPASQVHAIGDQVVLTAAVAGNFLSYRWLKNGVEIPGMTSPSLTLPQVQTVDSGNYTLVATNAGGASVSAVANLTVLTPPQITVPPVARTVVTAGQPLSLAVVATSDTALTYQWKKNGLPIAGATTPIYTHAMMTGSDGGYYTVEVKDSNGLVSQAVAFVNISFGRAQIAAWSYDIAHGLTVNAPVNLADAVAVSAGESHALALKADGTVVAWGDNQLGETTVPAGLNGVVEVAAGGVHSLALKSDGTVVAWGDNLFGETTVPTGLSGVVAISAGYNFSLALKSDGTVVGWGNGASGQLAMPTGLNNVVAITSGDDFSLALKGDGTVVAWGDNVDGQATVPAGLGQVFKVAAGATHSLALKADGTVVAWGDSYDGATNVPAGLGNGVDVTAGNRVSIVLKSDGTVAAWGDGSYGQVSVFTGLTDVMAVSMGDTGLVQLALRDASNDPLPVITTQPAATQTVLTGQAVTFSAAAAGGFVAYQWEKDGVAIAGANSPSLTLNNVQPNASGVYTVVATNAVGNVTSHDAVFTVIPPPAITLPPASRTVVQPGQPLTLAVTATGQAPLTYQWKRNGFPVAGATASTYGKSAVTSQDGGYYVVEITDGNGLVSRATAFVLISFGATEVVAWGANSSGQATVPGGLNNVVALAAGSAHSLALLADGTVVAWGDNSHGQTDIPSGLKSVVAVAAGNYHSLALKADGTVTAWGDNTVGQCSIPIGLDNVVAVAAGGNHSLVLKADSTVAIWGGSSQAGNSISWPVTNVTAIASSYSRFLVIHQNGTAEESPGSQFFDVPPPANLNGVAKIAAGNNAIIALISDGSVLTWNGSNLSLQAGMVPMPADLANVIAVAAGDQYYIAITATGVLKAWGSNSYGECFVPPGLGLVRLCAAGDNHALILRDASQDMLPLIVTPPMNQSVAAGQTATFSGFFRKSCGFELMANGG